MMKFKLSGDDSNAWEQMDENIMTMFAQLKTEYDCAADELNGDVEEIQEFLS